MHFTSLVLFALTSGTMAAKRFHVPEPARVRDEPTPTGCTSSALATQTTINRGNEGIWHVRANISDMHELYSFQKTDWLDNNKTEVLNTCGSICLAGNDTANPGTWLPSGKYFQGAFVNTPGGDPPNHILWECACYDRAVTANDLVAGGGVWNNANPGSGTIINRQC
ncbi:uncharacterized protein F4807DRAFT_145575 [Annulohypoxylon truncatum]|uniref:uncharacterized protein n=1 Tax=Annulohypoxylon truncatum TaxID=327061 RepID=UPI002007B88B|nr:uncharacterized protein F4807DRAFT_145575 [Annulohypoxylon truncatum]KAI1208671.1 hypothetical protein F4807DRAFT_145575 [Annulohypoxylon truncatum]